MTVLIKRNTSIPRSAEMTFSTSEDNQEMVNVKVYEGERAYVRENNFLGSFQLRGIPPAKSRVPRIKVTFNVDANGVLEVTAEEIALSSASGGGIKSHITIKNEKGRLSQQEIENMLAQAEKMKAEDDKIRARVEARNSIETFCFSLKQTCDDAKDRMSESDKEAIKSAADAALEWIDGDEGKKADADTINARYKDIEKIAHPILIQMYDKKFKEEHPDVPPAGTANPADTSSSTSSSGPSADPSQPPPPQYAPSYHTKTSVDEVD
jgi:L1 cell adhesion molecule like protein